MDTRRMTRFPGPALAGLRVIEVSAFVAAPLAGATLAALGADVIRVDPPGGGVDIDRWPLHEDVSLYRAGLNQGKRSIELDLKSSAGRGSRISPSPAGTPSSSFRWLGTT
jgi:2-methylfumaryl-CoA isomerase